VQLDEAVSWPSIEFEYGPFPRTRLDYDLFGFELGRFGRWSSFHASATVHTCRPGTHTAGICVVVKLMSDGRLELQS